MLKTAHPKGFLLVSQKLSFALDPLQTLTFVPLKSTREYGQVLDLQKEHEHTHTHTLINLTVSNIQPCYFLIKSCFYEKADIVNCKTEDMASFCRD